MATRPISDATRPLNDARRREDYRREDYRREDGGDERRREADRQARPRRPEDASAAQRTDPKAAEEGLAQKPDNYGVQELQLPPGFIIRRVIVGLAFYASWLPYIVVVAAREQHFQEALIFGVAWSGFCVLFHGILRLLKQKREWPYILDAAFLLFFIIYLPVYMRTGHTQQMFQWELVVLHLWLFFVMVGTVAARIPFTSQYAREEAPEEAWNAESFNSVCDHIAGVWAGSMGITGLLCLAPAILNRYQGKDGLNVMFNYVWPFGTFVLLLLGTRIWPGMIRRMYYLPRMLKGTVQPNNQPNSTNTTDSDGKTQQGAAQEGSAPPKPDVKQQQGAVQPAAPAAQRAPNGFVSARSGTGAGISPAGAAQGAKLYPPVPNGR